MTWLLSAAAAAAARAADVTGAGAFGAVEAGLGAAADGRGPAAWAASGDRSAQTALPARPRHSAPVPRTVFVPRVMSRLPKRRKLYRPRSLRPPIIRSSHPNLLPATAAKRLLARLLLSRKVIADASRRTSQPAPRGRAQPFFHLLTTASLPSSWRV